MIHTHVSVGDQKSPMNFGDVKKHWTFTTFTKPCSMEDDFKCPNFLVSTGSALVVLVESKLFYELSPENRRGGVPPNHPFSIGSFHYKPSILGYPHFWKPHITYIYIYISLSFYIYISWNLTTEVKRVRRWCKIQDPSDPRLGHSVWTSVQHPPCAGRLVLQGLDSPVHGLCCHPQLPLVAVCGYSGFLHMWSLWPMGGGE